VISITIGSENPKGEGHLENCKIFEAKYVLIFLKCIYKYSVVKGRNY